MPAPSPTTSTRSEWSAHINSFPCPEDASPAFRQKFTTLQRVFKLCAEHPAMAENNRQTYMTPAASKNKVYFIWDFIGRTLSMLNAVNPAHPSGEAWSEVKGRSATAGELIRDTTGKLEAMNQATGYNDDAGVDFGAEIMDAAKGLSD